MGDRNLYQIADGGVLSVLPSGLAIVRRRKHEYLKELEGMSRSELVRATDKIRGSKFLASWDLPRVCQWIEKQVSDAGWTLDLQEPNPLFMRLSEETGLVKGKRVHTICIRSDGRYIHAYPVEDRYE